MFYLHLRTSIYISQFPLQLKQAKFYKNLYAIKCFAALTLAKIYDVNMGDCYVYICCMRVIFHHRFSCHWNSYMLIPQKYCRRYETNSSNIRLLIHFQWKLSLEKIGQWKNHTVITQAKTFDSKLWLHSLQVFHY